jgi:hypothetical protein
MILCVITIIIIIIIIITIIIIIFPYLDERITLQNFRQLVKKQNFLYVI